MSDDLCPVCTGEKVTWSSQHRKCDEHNVCVICGIHRSKLADHPWGGSEGFTCRTCHDREAKEKREAALRKVAESEYLEWDYDFNKNPVCPHCGTEDDGWHGDPPPEGNYDCDVCGGKYSCEPDYEITFSTKVIGERVTLED